MVLYTHNINILYEIIICRLLLPTRRYIHHCSYATQEKTNVKKTYCTHITRAVYIQYTYMDTT